MHLTRASLWERPSISSDVKFFKEMLPVVTIRHRTWTLEDLLSQYVSFVSCLGAPLSRTETPPMLKNGRERELALLVI